MFPTPASNLSNGLPSPEPPPTRRIIATASLTFACYFIIGLQLAVVPVFVHWHLGFSPVVAGLVVSAQYITTLLSRPVVGHLCDVVGGKRTTAVALLVCALCGLLFFATMLLHEGRVGSLALLVVCRLILGVGESGVATGATLWGMGRVGLQHTAQVISWNGVASYGALAAGAPCGVWLESHWGMPSVGLVSVVVAGAAFGRSLVLRTAPVTVAAEEKTGWHRVFVRVLPYGLSLALSGVGFGVLASFISLYYANRHWANAGLALSVFGLAFVIVRLLFSRSIDRWGGYRVTLLSLSFQIAGLLLLWAATTPALALLGAALTGMGFSLVFPAMGVEAVRQVAAHSRGVALSLYTAFVDLSLGISGPVAGWIVGTMGYPPVFLFAATLTLGSLILCAMLYRQYRATNAHSSSETPVK